MRSLQFVSLCFFLLALPARAQHGTAPAGYYQPGYYGDTWTGVLTAANDATREITLSDSKKGKIETFTGVLKEGFTVKMKDGTIHELKVSEIAKDACLEAFYSVQTKKVNGTKVKINTIIDLHFLPKDKDGACRAPN